MSFNELSGSNPSVGTTHSPDRKPKDAPIPEHDETSGSSSDESSEHDNSTFQEESRASTSYQASTVDTHSDGTLELDELLRLQEDGEDIDLLRLYELELYYRDRHGEELNEDEIHDLEVFKAKKEEDRRYKREYDALLEARHNGESIDEGRLYHLDLLERVRSGDFLNDEELKELDAFEENERVRQSDTRQTQSSDGEDDEILSSKASTPEKSESSKKPSPEKSESSSSKTSTTPDSKASTPSRSEISSGGETDELEMLLDKQENGEQIDEVSQSEVNFHPVLSFVAWHLSKSFLFCS